MDHAALPDLDALDREALLDLIRTHEQQFASLIAAQDEEIRRLEAELDAHRQTMSEQAEELDSRRERIEHLKLMVEKFRHMIFGKKSEKLVLKLSRWSLSWKRTRLRRRRPKRSLNGSRRVRNRSVVPSASRCLNILNAKRSCTGPSAIAVRIAVAICATSVTTSLNNSSMFLRPSRSSAMCGRSSPAQAAIE
jgi:hypothetical protein